MELNVDDDLAWGGNTQPVALGSPELSEDGSQAAIRGRLTLTGEGGAVLRVGDSQLLFDVTDPSPLVAVDGTWVAVLAGRDSISLYFYSL
ncbi:hypothetical protein [Streptomyces sp. HB132]|uniref:hypothetical protein n=1 Tax=Streptomyces sp. HB132 TaxID=767388 RepID=UPI001D6CE9FD|nr:hypothetical protein [Streptomyces sp. HB132]MBM7442106.1 hypothetical protein [Streptomyces sp. HB132]